MTPHRPSAAAPCPSGRGGELQYQCFTASFDGPPRATRRIAFALRNRYNAHNGN